MANVDGKISYAREAKISIVDRGFLYGDSIYEVFPTYDGVPFLYEEHIDRLENSAQLAQMKISQPRDLLFTEIKKTHQRYQENAKTEAYIRLTITRGIGPIDLDPNNFTSTSYVILVKEVPTWDQELYTKGVTLAIPSIRRNHSQSLEPNIKGGNYLNNILAVGEAKKLGAEDALICNLDGDFTEASNSNVFFVEDNTIITPDQSSGNLKGITKETLEKICKKENIPFQHEKMNSKTIKHASECFISSATREVMPVQSLRLEDGSIRKFPLGGGEYTKKLSSLYKDFVTEYVRNHQEKKL